MYKLIIIHRPVSLSQYYLIYCSYRDLLVFPRPAGLRDIIITLISWLSSLLAIDFL